MSRLLFYLISLIFVPVIAQGQADSVEEQKQLIFFTDKSNSPYSIAEPLKYLSEKALKRRQKQHIALTSRDLPVNPAYVSGLKRTGAKVWYTSRWFNAAVVECSADVLSQLQELPYVQSSKALSRATSPDPELLQLPKLEHTFSVRTLPLPKPDSLAYGLTYHQANMLGATNLHAAGFHGEGMTIAVLDAGFPAVNTLPAFSHLFEHNQVKGIFDFVLKQAGSFTGDAHGTAVLSTMAAYEPGKAIGTAYKANYLLLRTEDAATEHHIEEINWLLAAEYADSAGADVLNSSLGYSTFDTPSVSYTYSQLNGNTTLVTKAADYAAATGMLVVVSAGNEGAKPWHYISAPADADSVLAVGAVDSLGVKASFSSFGPTADGRIKPDLVALGFKVYVLSASGNLSQSYGTSFSGPIVAGFAASLWQALPYKTNMEMLKLLRDSSSNFSSPDNATGYGVPHVSQIKGLDTILPSLNSEDIYITNPVHENEIVLSLNQVWAKQQVIIHILDATGKVIYKQALPPHQTRHVLELKPDTLKQGLYLCRVYAGGQSSTLRFIKL